MNIYTTLHIGSYHTLHCEDDLITAPIGDGMQLCAVMDGCTMGTDSHLPATATAKLLRKIAKTIYYRTFAENGKPGAGELLETTLRELFAQWRQLKQHLQLEREDTLNTLLLAIIDENEGLVEGICIGDGCVYFDGDMIEFDQDNVPDYLGYHLHEDFPVWFNAQRQRFSRKGVHSCSLATDGLFTFSRFDQLLYPAAGNVFEYLLHDDQGKSNPDMLGRKMTEIAMDWGMRPTDDLALIRIEL